MKQSVSFVCGGGGGVTEGELNWANVSHAYTCSDKGDGTPDFAELRVVETEILQGQRCHNTEALSADKKPLTQ
jgi:hypothetical protein